MSASTELAADAHGPALTEEVVRLVELKRRFGATPALDGVSLTVRKGEILGIIGRSGAGKSTLIRCLNGLERPRFRARSSSKAARSAGLAERDLQPLRRRIGMIFQHFNLLSAKTVEDNVALPLKIAGRPRAETASARGRTARPGRPVGEGQEPIPSQLSGGQKQRVGIARALAARPALLLSDEATSALDPETTRSILALLKDINRQLGLTILLDHPRDGGDPLDRRPRRGDRSPGASSSKGRSGRCLPTRSRTITRSLLGAIRPQLADRTRRRGFAERPARRRCCRRGRRRRSGARPAAVRPVAAGPGLRSASSMAASNISSGSPSARCFSPFRGAGNPLRRVNIPEGPRRAGGGAWLCRR